MRTLAALALLLLGSSPYDDGTTPFDVSPTTASPTTTTSAISKAPVFAFAPDAAAIASGPGKLSDSLDVGGVPMTLVLSCDARAITGTTWPCTSASGTVTLNEAGAGASPTLTTFTPFTEAAARGVQFTGKYYQASSSSVGDVGASDFIIEWVWGHDPATFANDLLFSTWDGTGLGTKGVRLMQWTFEAFPGGGAGQIASSGDSVAAGGTQHELCIVNRSEATQGLACFGNGRVNSGAYGSLNGVDVTPSQAMTIGGGIGMTPWRGKLYALRIWKCTDCMPDGALTGTTWDDTLALSRFAALVGTTPTIAASPAPIFARASSAMVEVNNGSTTRLEQVGYNYPRIVEWKDSDGTLRRGYLDEPPSTNLATYSRHFDNAAWAKTQLAVTADQVAAPDGTTTADKLEATDGAGSVEHFVRQSITLTATTHTASVYVAAGADSATHAWLRDNTVANAVGWVRLSDCSKGTKGAGLSAMSTWIVSGGCRLAITFDGTAAAHDIDVGYSNADAVTAYDDGTDSTADLYAWGDQVEAGSTATTFIPTTSAAASRAGDGIEYEVTIPAGAPATLEVSVVVDAHPSYFYETGARIPLRLGASGSNPAFYIAGQYCGWAALEMDDVLYGASAAAPTDDYCTTPRKFTRIRGVVTATSITAYNTAGAAATTSATARNPATARIKIGSYADAGHLRGIVTSAYVWPRAWSPAEVP